MQRSASVGSDMHAHEGHAEQQPARHTEDAVLRQMNLHLMGRGHAKSARDAVAMYSRVPGNLTPNKTKVVRVALTGGPCAGKSSALEHLVERATDEGFDIMTAPEVATLYFNSSYQLPSASSEDFMEQLFLFQKNVMKLQLQMERCFSELAGSTGRPTIVIFDRGVLDSRAFIPEHLWARGVAALNRELTGCTADGSKRPEGSISNEYLLKRYDGVVHLVTAADGAEAHYKHGVVHDDRGQTVYRRETPAEAVAQDRKLQQAWAEHPCHVVVSNGAQGFKQKIEQATEAVLRIARTQHPKEAARAQKVAVERRKTAELKTAAQGGALPADAHAAVKVAAQ